MTIKEYKKEFLAIAKRLEEEHGVVERIEIEHSSNISDMSGAVFDFYIIKIKM